MGNASSEDDQTKRGVTMFAGKGGVGKTTCAAATALHHALRGRRTLAISTDATPSLAHIFDIGGEAKPARVLDSLYIRELGMDEVKSMWDQKFGSEVYEVFSTFVSIEYDEFVEFMTSVLPGMSDEFMVDYIRELNRENEYDAIVWDTAPLGQTLALLQTPSLLIHHLRTAPRIYSRLRLGRRSKEPILDILKRWETLAEEDMNFLKNEVRFTLVTVPEALAVAQLEGAFREVDSYGLRIEQMIVNNVVREEDSDFLARKASEQKHYLHLIYDRYPDLPIVEVPMFPYELKGVQRLKQIEKVLFPASCRGIRASGPWAC